MEPINLGIRMGSDNPIDIQLKELFFKQEFDAQKWNRHLNLFIEGVFQVVEQNLNISLEDNAQELLLSEDMKDQKNAFKQFIIGELTRIERSVEDFIKIKLRGAEYHANQLYELTIKSVVLNEMLTGEGSSMKSTEKTSSASEESS
jgi:hypothetical protein